MANARAGSVVAASAMAPAALAVPLMKRRRVIVSPSNAPGTWRSVVYLDAGWRDRGRRVISPTLERAGSDGQLIPSTMLHNTIRHNNSGRSCSNGCATLARLLYDPG